MQGDGYLKSNYYESVPTIQFDPSSVWRYWLGMAVCVAATFLLLFLVMPITMSSVLIAIAPFFVGLLIFRRFLQYLYNKRKLAIRGQQAVAEVTHRDFRSHVGFAFGRYKDYAEHLVLDMKFLGDTYPIYIHNHRAFSSGGVDIEGADIGSKFKVLYDPGNPRRFQILAHEDGTRLIYTHPPRSAFYKFILPFAALSVIVIVVILSSFL